MATRVLVPSGVLGLGFDHEALWRAAALPEDQRPHIICIDGGSTDSGPFYLGAGISKYSYAACKSEWRELIKLRAQLEVPLVITSCGTCGTNSMVDWMLQMTRELFEELEETEQQVQIALLYCEPPADLLLQKFHQNNISALQPDIGLSTDTLSDATHCVALAGAEQINLALSGGAEIVLAGRSTDTASIAALPLSRGEHAGAAWHAAKIAECGALCSDNPTSGVIMVEVDDTGFTVAPLAKGASCTPHSVSAHMLYENSDPFVLYEPGGALHVQTAEYQPAKMTGIDNPAVRVTGSIWHADENYTVKLEGARLAGYQVTQLVLLRDAHYVAHAQQWVDRLETFLHAEILHRMQLQQPSDYTLEFRLIGVDSVLGVAENQQALPVEVGVLVITTAGSDEMAAEIAKLANPFLLHYPLTDSEELPTFAFPYSPAESSRGKLYEFCLNHVMTLQQPMDGFRLQSVTAGNITVNEVAAGSS